MRDAFTLHRLTRHDVARMRELNAVFGEAFEDTEHYAARPPDDAYLAELLDRSHVIALAAVEAGAVIGGLVAYELDKFEQARREIYIYDLAVAEAHRRKGVATALIGDLSRIAGDRGAWVIYVQADYGDEPAIALYEKLGAREDVMHFDIMPAAKSPQA